MKTRNLLLLLCAAATAAACSSEKNVKLMSYNVNNCFGMDSVTNCQRVADIILAESPDVVALQELDSMTTRFPAYVLGELAAATSMNAVYGPSADIEGGKTGVGILSKEEPVAVRTVQLPGSGDGNVVLIAEFKKFCFGCVTMSRSHADQIASVAIVKEEAAKAGKPFFFGGSLNARFGSQTISSLAKDFTALTNISARTYPADQPIALVDYLFMYNRNLKHFEIDNVAVLNEPVASDHRPAVANVSFR